MLLYSVGLASVVIVGRCEVSNTARADVVEQLERSIATVRDEGDGGKVACS